MTKALVLGAYGLIGAACAAALERRGVEVTGMDRSAAQARTHRPCDAGGAVSYEILSFLHVIGACVLLGVGAAFAAAPGILWLMLTRRAAPF
ncbi:MAG: NAD-dependent epimerase/dehydratase family protein [Pikeienuella sp.]